MNLIVPMAGMGKRLRPHTLTTPKPLIPIAGKPIVQRLVEDIAAVTPEKIEHIGFVVGDFGPETEAQLLQIAQAVGATGHIFYQQEALGTAHAVHCAREVLQGRVTVAFSDTLFKANFTLNTEDDGIIWVKRVEDLALTTVKAHADRVDGFHTEDVRMARLQPLHNGCSVLAFGVRDAFIEAGPIAGQVILLQRDAITNDCWAPSVNRCSPMHCHCLELNVGCPRLGRGQGDTRFCFGRHKVTARSRCAVIVV